MRFLLLIVVMMLAACSQKQGAANGGDTAAESTSDASAEGGGIANATQASQSKALDSIHAADPTKDPRNNTYYVTEDRLLLVYPDKNIRQIKEDLMKIPGILDVSMTEDGKLLAVKGDPNQFNLITKIFFK